MPKPESRAAVFALVLAVALVSALMAFGVTKEIPVAPVTGAVTMFENKRPLPNAFVTFSPEEAQTLDGPSRDYTVRTDKEGKFRFRRLPAGNYNVWVRGTAHSVEQRMVTVLEATTNVLDFEAIPGKPSINTEFQTPVFLPDEQVKVKSSGYSTDRKLHLVVNQVQAEEIKGSRNLINVLTAVTQNINREDPNKLGKGQKVYESDIDPDLIDLEGQFTTLLKLPKLPRGVYCARLTTKDAGRSFWFTVTDLGLVTKTGEHHGTAWAVDLKTGKPRANVSVDLVTSEGTTHVGETNADGLLTFDTPRTNPEDKQTMLMASSGENRAYTWWFPETEGQSDVAWTVTDRPVYRAGDTVNFKSFLRRPLEKGYAPATLTQVDVELRGPEGDVVATAKKQVRGDGAIDGSFKIEEESPTGSYEIVLKSGEWEDSHYFPVAQYRKPEYNIQVKPDRKAAYAGDRVPVTISVTTYTGEPAVSAKVSANVYRQARYWEDEGYDFGEDTDQAEFVDSHELTTDAQGQVTITVDTARQSVGGKKKPEVPDSELFQIKVDVTGTGDRYYSGQGSFRSYQGDLRLEAETTDYLAASGKPVKVQVSATERETGKPASGPVAATLSRTNLERTDREAEEGKPYRQVHTDYAVVTAHLDAMGHAVLDLVPDKPGDYEVVVFMTDSRGHKVESRVGFWVSGGKEDPDDSFLGVELDKKVYKTNDKPKAVVRTDKPGASILIAVETADVTWTKVLPMPNEVTVVDLPSLAETPMGASVTLCRVENRDMQTAQAEVVVGERGKRLKVNVTSDKKKVKPGEDVTYLVQTTDEGGKPVSADLAFSVVDESVFAIREDANDPNKTFWPARSSMVQTTWSFPYIYFDGGDKSPAEIKVRRDFKDTAFWTADLRTGPDGTTKVHVRLPDNLTEWRATACAVDSEAAAGKGRSAVIATQELMARLSLPPFMVQADVQQVSATLTNTTDQAQRVAVDLSLQGAKTADKASLDADVPANSSKVVSWNLEAGQPGIATVKLTARSMAGPSDAVEMPLPVHTNGVPEYWHAGGIVGGQGRPSEVGYVLELAKETATGNLEARLAPGLAGTLLSRVDELVDYPYGCVEQTLSKMLPAVLTVHTLERSGYTDPELNKKVEEVLRRGFARLRDMRRYGGGWGWFRNDQPDPWVTAVALESFHKLQEEGVPPKESWAKKDVEWALGELRTPPRDTWEAHRRLQLVAAVAGYTQQDALVKALADIWRTGIDKDKTLGAESIAWATLAYSRLSRSADAAVAAAANAELPQWIERLMNVAPRTAAEGAPYGSGESVAVVMVEVAPDSPVTQDVVYRLATPPVRQSLSDTWLLHRSVAAVAGYLKRHPERLGSGDAEVLVNGSSFGKVSLREPARIKVPLAGLKLGLNAVKVRVTGNSTATYAFDFKGTVYDPAAKPLMLQSGFSIERSYHKMEVGVSDGVRRLVPAKDPSTSFASGEVYRVRLTVRNKVALRYVAIEDFVPSNARTVELDRTLDGNSDWGYWWVGADFRDDRTVYFARDLPAGEHVLEYAVRAESPGTCYAPPASAYPMYDPGMVVRTGTGRLTVTSK